MANYYVDWKNGNDGSAGTSQGAAFKTPSKANSVVNNGDTVFFLGSKDDQSTYYNGTLGQISFNVKKEGTTWKALTGHTPTWDGKYGPHLFVNPKPMSGLPPGGGGSMIGASAPNVTFDGLRIINSPGTGMGFSGEAHGGAILRCYVDFCWAGCLILNGNNPNNRLNNIEIGFSTFKRASQQYFDAFYQNNSDGKGCKRNGICVQGTCQLICTDSIWFHDNVVAFSMGEGINIGRGSQNGLVEGNIVNSCNHVGIYINRSGDTILRRNLVFHNYNEINLGADPEPPAGIIVGDEVTDKMAGYPFSYGQIIYDNIVINNDPLFDVRNNTKADGYNSQLVDAYIGYNTFIAGDKTTNAVRITQNSQGRGHKNTIFEGNIIVGKGTANLFSGSSSGITFRNNAWSAAPPAAASGPGDKIGSGTGQSKTFVLNAYDEITNGRPDETLEANGVNLNNYKLPSNSPLIGAGPPHTEINGMTPPSGASPDYFGNARTDAPGGKWDIGAHEVTGVTSVDTLTAAVSLSPSSGDSPLTVTFVNTSVSSGTITESSYDFGEGAAAVLAGKADTTHTYTSPGVYHPKLKVTDNNGLIDIVNGPTVTVLAPPSGGDPTGIDVVRGHANQTSFTFNLGGETPNLVLFYMVGDTAVDGSSTADAILSIGAAESSSVQHSAAIRSKSGVTPTASSRISSNTSAITLIDQLGAIVAESRVTGFSANTVTMLPTTAFPTNMTVVAVAFSGVIRKLSSVRLETAGSTAQLSNPGSTPQIRLFYSTLPSTTNEGRDQADMTLAMAAPGIQVGYKQRQRNGLATTADIAYLTTNRLTQHSGALVNLTNFDSGTVQVEDVDINGYLNSIAIAIPGGDAAVKREASPIATGSVAYTLPWQPDLLIIHATLVDSVDTQLTNNRTEGFAIAVVKPSATYAVSVASKDNTSPSQSSTRSSDSIAVYGRDATLKLAGTVSITPTGYSINWTTVDTVPLQFLVSAFKAGTAGPVDYPVAEFVADTRRVTDGIISFTDLSSSSVAITDWLWDFGDGETSTEQNPVHQYEVDNFYTVSLTVTNANGSDTEQKVNYIEVYSEVTADFILHGPFFHQSVTNYSDNITHYQSADDPDLGKISAKLDLDVLAFDMEPDLSLWRASGRQKIALYFDRATNELVVEFPTGFTGASGKTVMRFTPSSTS